MAWLEVQEAALSSIKSALCLVIGHRLYRRAVPAGHVIFSSTGVADVIKDMEIEDQCQRWKVEPSIRSMSIRGPEMSIEIKATDSSERKAWKKKTVCRCTQELEKVLKVA